MEYNSCPSLFSSNETVDELELAVTNIEEAKPTLSAIRNSQTLKTLFLSSSGHDDEVEAVCRTALKESCSLETLTLELINTTDKGMLKVAIILKTIVKLTSLTLRLNNVTHVGAEAIADVLESKGFLSFSIHGTQMDLHDLCIEDKGAKSIAVATQQCLTLKTLRIAQSGLTSTGVNAIMSSLELHPSLSVLDLSGNAIDECGLASIASSLPKLPNIKELVLDNNNIGNAPFHKLSPTDHAHTIKTLSLRSCNITKEGLALLVKGTSELETLILSGNKHIGNEGVQLLGKFLQTNQVSMRNLDLSSCGIEDEGCASLGESLLTNTSLVQLSLQCNHIGDSGVIALTTALQTNR